MYKRQLSIILSIAVLAIAHITIAAGPVKKCTKPLKVYLLAGQSNMQGKAQPFTIAAMKDDPASKAIYHKIVDENGKPRVHDDVSIIYHTLGDTKGGHHRPLRTAAGKLSIGFGEAIGPELGFGITVDEVNDEPIFIIKTAWGGKSLYKNFRPPSAGVRPVELTDTEWDEKVTAWKKAGTYDEEVENLKKGMEEKNYGYHYKLMIKLIKEALADPSKLCPAYDPKLGYEIAGFAWFQGFNDMLAPYPVVDQKNKIKDYSEYTRLMACFIRDVRKEFGVPDMPFVIGAMGLGGDEDKIVLNKYMHATADLPKFKGNVTSVNTAQYWDHYIGDAKKKSKAWGTYQKKAGYQYLEGEDVLSLRDPEAQYGWATLGTPGLEERQWRYTTIQLDPRDYPLPKEEQDRLAEAKEAGEEVFPLFNEDGVVVSGAGEITQNPEHMLGIVAEGLEDWYKPEFDDSKWKVGPAPFGHGKWTGGGKRHGGKKLHVPVRTPFDNKSRILMRTPFEVDDLEYGACRLNILAKNQHVVYLNGHEIRRYVWWTSDPVYKGFDLTEEQVKYLKKGKNVLAVYATTKDKGKHGKPAAEAIDSFLEGMSKKDAAAYYKKKEELYPKIYEAAQAGISNAEFHYMGSAKIYSRIGEALAKAMIELERRRR